MRSISATRIDAHLKANQEIKDFLGRAKWNRGSTVIYSKGGPNVTLKSVSTTKGEFDNDPDTLNSTWRIIRGSNTLVKDVQNAI